MMTIGIGKAEINKVLGKGAKAPEPIPSEEEIVIKNTITLDGEKVAEQEKVVKPKRTRKKKEE